MGKEFYTVARGAMRLVDIICLTEMVTSLKVCPEYIGTYRASKAVISYRVGREFHMHREVSTLFIADV